MHRNCLLNRGKWSAAFLAVAQKYIIASLSFPEIRNSFLQIITKKRFLFCFRTAWSKYCFAFCGRRTKVVKHLISRTVPVTDRCCWINEAAIISPRCGWLRLVLGLHSMVFITAPEINRAQTILRPCLWISNLYYFWKLWNLCQLVVKESTSLILFPTPTT